jgi:ParB-like chromosome segregation protein Spo0J
VISDQQHESASHLQAEPVGIPLERIRRPDSCFPREDVDWERVQELAELISDSGPDAVPPVILVDDQAGGFVRADGEHRLSALEQLGAETASAFVLQPPPGRAPLEFAYEVALRECATAAKPLTHQERRTAVYRLLGERPELSDRQVAQLAGCSHQTVGRVRRDGPTDQASTAPKRELAPEQAAVRLIRGFGKLQKARGSGFLAWFSGADGTGERFADALWEVYDEGAAGQARLFTQWLSQAVELLEAEDDE